MENSAEEKKPDIVPVDDDPEVPVSNIQDLINASGHVQELDRNFGFWSICATSLVIDNAWGAGAAALLTAFYNGGATGVIYEFIVACLFYFCIGAGLAELASAIPSSASVYHWASVTAGPRYGRIASFYAGWWNALSWIFGGASVSLGAANAVIAIYSLYHPDYTPERWQVFIAYLLVTWITAAIVMFGQRVLPHVANAGAVLCLAIWLVTTLVCAIMPSQTGAGYASNSFVWGEFNNQTGWSSNGFVFVAGMLNGAYAIGTPDGCTHLAEEIPEPKKNIPKGILAQLTTGFLTTFVFYIAVLYAITDIDAVFNTNIVGLPLAAMYLQATRSRGGAAALLVLFFVDLIVTIPGAYITAGRMLWTLARDDATPFSKQLSRVSPTWRNPFFATFICGCASTILGCIYIGSAQAFNAFVGCFAILTTMSYLVPILTHLLTRRQYVKPGPFWMPGIWGYLVMGSACAYIIVFNVIYMFPFTYPVTVQTMNYACVLVGGLTILVTAWYMWKRTRGYVGPRVVLEAHDDVTRGVILTPEQLRMAERRASLQAAADGKT